MTTTAKPLNKCPRRHEPHPRHAITLYFGGMGAVVPTTCPGLAAPALCSDCWEAQHGEEPDMGDDLTWEPGTCTHCAVQQTVFSPA